jgi:hypothetical protein
VEGIYLYRERNAESSLPIQKESNNSLNVNQDTSSHTLNVNSVSIKPNNEIIQDNFI